VSTAVARMPQAELVRMLGARIRAVADALGVEHEGRTNGGLLQELALRVKTSRRDDEAWLLYVGLTSTFPNPLEFANFKQVLELSRPALAIIAVLEACLDSASKPDVLERDIRIISDEVIVDVNFCATNEHNTGIQRVVRETLPEWTSAERPIHLVAWTSDSSAMREIDEIESDRVLHWNDRQIEPGTYLPVDPHHRDTVIVPWRTQVFLPEVPSPSTCANLACLAQASGNTVSLIGYDAIPLVSAETQPPTESERFAHYLTIVKHASTVIGISASAALEFEGFTAALAAQGLAGPVVKSVPLAVDVPAAALAVNPPAPVRPVILCVGSHEPRKNQDAVIFAAEVLFREGFDFSMIFVGGGSRLATQDFDQRVSALHKQGLDVQSFRSLSDRELWSLYGQARFTVFVSLHEGFGLPVAESLALRTPVLASNFGSVAEIAALGGCVMVDPRDDEQIVDGMRKMLTDDDLITRLTGEALEAPRKTWKSYADELWHAGRTELAGQK
jgi:glycosyltransferase involved in cell wall biosynthesis